MLQIFGEKGNSGCIVLWIFAYTVTNTKHYKVVKIINMGLHVFEDNTVKTKNLLKREFNLTNWSSRYI